MAASRDMASVKPTSHFTHGTKKCLQRGKFKSWGNAFTFFHPLQLSEI
jgi:hypothetical protein